MVRSLLLTPLAILLIAAPLSPVCAQPADGQAYDWSTASPVDRLLARRAARLDAMRELGELLRALPIADGRRLGDLQPELSAFLAGARETAKPQFAADGFCRLTLAIPLDVVLEQASRLARARGEHLDEATVRRAVGQQLEATGLGRPRNAPRVLAPPSGPAQPEAAPQPRDERQGLREQDERDRQWQEEQRRRDERWRRQQAERDQRWSEPERRKDPDVEAFERRQMERWRAWKARESAWGDRHRAQQQIGEQWRQGQPSASGWRTLPDGSQVRLLSERITERTPVVTRRQTADGWVVTERTVERVIERTYQQR